MSTRDNSSGISLPTYDGQVPNGAPPTYAAFSPVTLSANTPSRSARRSTILVHQKSPLLLATPPQVTRALAYSHPFILPLNTLAGLLTWSSGDPWQSFLLLCAFWAVTLYGDIVVRWVGPVVVGASLIGGMYGRRYSPLSSSGWNEPGRDSKDGRLKNAGAGGPSQPKGNVANTSEKQTKHARNTSEVTNTKHQKTLDEIVDTLKELTGRCNALLEPLIEMTDFLSTQRTPTSATTRPALTALFMRLLIITPFWMILAAPPLKLISTRRVVLVAGTLILTWHSRVMRVSRAILWRSTMVRRVATITTGLEFEKPVKAMKPKDFAAKKGSIKAGKSESELTKAIKSPSLNVNHRRSGSDKSAGVKFTFIIYENQRRWVGLGWTTSLFAYERPAWTDEHNNPVPPKDEFELPEVEDESNMRWKWASGSRWRVDGVADDHGLVDYDGDVGKTGWIYYDNKWGNGRRGQDGWGRWTRRRKWYRDAELVEMEEKPAAHELDASLPKVTVSELHSGYSTVGEKMVTPSMRVEPVLPQLDHSIAEHIPHSADDHSSNATAGDDSLSLASTSSKSWGFRAPSLRRRPTDRSSVDRDLNRRARRTSDVFADEDESTRGLGIEVETEIHKGGKDGGQWGISEESRMSLE
ncbi:unnamed protein product [Clonostachys byssicola]|uniref:Peroxin/Ferlin domain-containing protein n=1 Tax=Clonostachys byssicola TaxID=160290 RepID=A0A9N9UV50_9HYPO|nr:unnamed protein product [Clonostachys byssicola]